MKINKFFIYLLIALPTLLMQSCLKDQEDLFDKPSALRMQSALEETHKILSSSEHGWVLNIFPGKKQELGGYAFTCKFDSMQVAVRSELSDDEVKSYYKMTNDMGPVLTFDTYNRLMHVFSTPSSQRYQGYNGDFEFVIDSLSSNLIKTHGKRVDGVLYLKKLTEPAKDYIKKVSAMERSIARSPILYIVGKLGTAVAKITLDITNRTVSYVDTLATSAEEETVSFAYTDKGIFFYKPITLGGVSISELEYNAATTAFIGKDDKGNTVTLEGRSFAGYIPFDDFAGEYDFIYNSGNTTLDVKLTPDESKWEYVMSGLNPNYTIRLKYNRKEGRLELYGQIVGQATNGNSIFLAPWALAAGGNLWLSQTYGVSTVWNKDKDHPVYSFQTLPVNPKVIDSFILWQLTPAGKSAGILTESEFLVNGNSRIPYIVSLKKK